MNFKTFTEWMEGLKLFDPTQPPPEDGWPVVLRTPDKFWGQEAKMLKSDQRSGLVKILRPDNVIVWLSHKEFEFPKVVHEPDDADTVKNNADKNYPND